MSIRFLVLSDTHDDAFPATDLATRKGPGREIDVVLHCGDLTMIGGLSNYRRALANLRAIDAELKLVIAGNHDVSLDPNWWTANLIEDEDDADEPAKALALFEAEKKNGIFLLDEGTHNFTLADGREFSIFASPYTPEYNGYAFYSPDQEHWANKIPEGVDVVMTHGPSRVPLDSYRLDRNHDGEHCGCPKLFEAILKAKPGLHCFGHTHEGNGSQVVKWVAEGTAPEMVPSEGGKDLATASGDGTTPLMNGHHESW